MAQKRKKRTVTYDVHIECYTDFMEELCDGGFKIALWSLNNYLDQKGYSKTKMWFTKGNKKIV